MDLMLRIKQTTFELLLYNHDKYVWTFRLLTGPSFLTLLALFRKLPISQKNVLIKALQREFGAYMLPF